MHNWEIVCPSHPYGQSPVKMGISILTDNLAYVYNADKMTQNKRLHQKAQPSKLKYKPYTQR